VTCYDATPGGISAIEHICAYFAYVYNVLSVRKLVSHVGDGSFGWSAGVRLCWA
jgi:hypothetical protein